MIYMFGRLKKLDNPDYNPFNNKATLKEKIMEYYELRECEEPYIWAKEHFILRDTNKEVSLEFQESIKRRVREQTLNRYKKLGYTIIDNAYSDKSVPKWEHTHIIKPKHFRTIQDINNWALKLMRDNTKWNKRDVLKNK